jgi:DNA repair protein RadC
MNESLLSTMLSENTARESSHDHYNSRKDESHLDTYSDVELLASFINGPVATRLNRAELALSNSKGLAGFLQDCIARKENDRVADNVMRFRMQAAVELVQRSIRQTIKNCDIVDSPKKVRELFSLHLSGRQHEVMAALLLDNRHRVIEYRELFTGTIDSAAVYPREVVKHCLRCNAAAIVLGHNHPSGVAEPSDTDVRLTRKLVDALALIDVRVLDHLVIGQGEMTSLAERGLM